MVDQGRVSSRARNREDKVPGTPCLCNEEGWSRVVVCRRARNKKDKRTYGTVANKEDSDRKLETTGVCQRLTHRAFNVVPEARDCAL